MTTLPGLLLLHGVGDSGECWGPFVHRLRATADGRLADLEVSTPNAPAHGGDRSGPGRTIAAADQLAIAVGHAQDLVRRSGAPVVVGGHSMGSAVALAVAATRPDLVAALWLEDPPFTTSMSDDDAAPREPVDVSEFGRWFASLKDRDFAEVVALVRTEHPGWDQGEYEPWVRAKQAVDVDAFVEPVSWIGAGWARMARSITVPTVLVAGDPDVGSIVHPQAAADLGALPGWSLHQVATGHDVRRDDPQKVVGLLADLILSVAA